MELKDFIKDTLLAITYGVDEANAIKPRFRIANAIHCDGTSGETVEFDVGIEVTDSSQKNAKGGIGVSVAKIGGEVNSGQTNHNTHRLKFRVFITESK